MPAPPPAFVDAARRTKVSAAVPEVDAILAEAVKKQKLPGLAAGLVVDGDLVWSKGYGVKDVGGSDPVDADTVFRIGSITKTFTAEAILKLRDAGALSLDAPASTYLPELASVVYPTADSAPLTVRELLTHSSGLPRLGNYSYIDPKHTPTEKEVTESLRGLPLAYAPETETEYSNLGYAVLGILAGRVAKTPFRAYVEDAIVRPLGMTSTTWDEQEVPSGRLATAYSRESDSLKREAHWRMGAGEGSGGLYSTVRDMARFASMQLAAWPARDDAESLPLRRSTLREAQTAHGGLELRADAQPTRLTAHAEADGFAWQAYVDCDLDRVVRKNGRTEGYAASLTMLPTRGVALILLSNLQTADLEPTALEVLHALARANAIAPRELRASGALVEARERLTRLFDRWDDAEATRLLAPVFVNEPRFGGRGFAAIREQWDDARRRLGACHADGEMRVESVTHGRFALACERGSFAIDLYLSSVSPVQILGFGERVIPAPSATLGTIAPRIVGLIERWDDATYDQLLAHAFPKDEIKPFFQRLSVTAKSCKLDHPTDGDGERRAAWRIVCANGPHELTLRIDAATATVSELWVHPAPDAQTRCAR